MILCSLFVRCPKNILFGNKKVLLFQSLFLFAKTVVVVDFVVAKVVVVG
jgi:hypothetical protein